MLRLLMVLLATTISGCYSTSPLIRLHEAVASSEGKRMCYKIYEPEEISGRYCITFEDKVYDKEELQLVGD